MEEDILRELGMNDRNEVVIFLKSLWTSKPKPCPKCGGKMDFLHKKIKKSNCDWKCLACGKIYRTINILNSLNER